MPSLLAPTPLAELVDMVAAAPHAPSSSSSGPQLSIHPPQHTHQTQVWSGSEQHVDEAMMPQFEDYNVEMVLAEEARKFGIPGRSTGQAIFRGDYTLVRAPSIVEDGGRASTPAMPTPAPMPPSRMDRTAIASAVPLPVVPPARVEAAAAPTPSPFASQHRLDRRDPWPNGKNDCSSHRHHPDCHCESPPCGIQTDVVWVHQTTLLDQPAPPAATPVCYTLTSTSTYWETNLGIWQTSVFPVESTQWVWEQIPHVVTSASTAYKHTVVGGGGSICRKPPSDWCQDGWMNGIWLGTGTEPCWSGNSPVADGWWTNKRPFFPDLYDPQIVTLAMIPVFLVVITILWAIKKLSLWVLLPYQMYTNLVHELAHCFAGLLGGARICSVGIDPGCGPISTMRNGQPLFTLLAGYIGSITFGTIMVFLAFDEKASKVMYLVHCPLWLMVFWFAQGILVKLQVVVAAGNGIVLWFVFQSRVLRFYNLFLGLMSLFYVVWDTLDDLLYRKQNESDSGLLSRLVPGSRPIIWGILFTLIASGHLAMAMCFGVHFFRGDIHAPSVNFLPAYHIGRSDLRAQDAAKKY